MQLKSRLILLLTLFKNITSIPTPDTSSLVVSTTEKVENEKVTDEGNKNNISVNPQIYSMEIRTNITNRFATTLVTSKVRNLKKTAAETTFAVILPENAFISEFTMEIDDKIYKAYVKEKKEAKKIYEEAVSRGQSAAHVELSARDSKNFQVSVNIEPESKTTFRLTYEELLQRQNGQYELIVNIHPGQIVDNLNVEVYINESRPLTFVRTPSLRTGNEISKNEEQLKPNTEVNIFNSTSAVVKFKPEKSDQTKFAGFLGTEKENGLAGQFVVQYDVERDPQGGEVLIRDGYFVHFFSPSDLKPLPKHVVFVLDHSSSMWGRKIGQLTEAMKNVLSDLKENDLFNIVRFTESVSVWNPSENKFDTVNLPHSVKYGELEPHLRELNISEAVEASVENVEKGKKVVEDHGDMGLTNIMVGLEVGLFLVKSTQEKNPDKYQPMIIFLTDGLPNVGMSSTNQITDTVTKINSGLASIFSLSFGSGADKSFLRKLSLRNLGFANHIYEAADASLQLQDFYRKISSPLLKNVTFKYLDGVTDVTKTNYPFLFNGSELVVAGRTNNDNIPLDVHGNCKTGPIHFTPVKEEPISSVERLWAYLTVQQLLKEKESAEDPKNVTKKAVDLALKYSFVTDVTSLVVVKPNQTQTTGDHVVNADSPKYDSSFSSRLQYNAPIPRSGVYRFSMPARKHHSALQGRRIFTLNRLARPDIAHNIIPPGLMGPQPLEGNYSYRTDRPFVTPNTTTTTTTKPNTKNEHMKKIFTPKYNISAVPKWLEDLQVNNQNITTPQGLFQLGKTGDVTSALSCSNTPLNSTGQCTLIFDCPHIFSLLPNVNAYLNYFCPLNEFAGVCCPMSTASIP